MYHLKLDCDKLKMCALNPKMNIKMTYWRVITNAPTKEYRIIKIN